MGRPAEGETSGPLGNREEGLREVAEKADQERFFPLLSERESSRPDLPGSMAEPANAPFKVHSPVYASHSLRIDLI